MLLDRVSNPGPLTYESGALPIALRGPAPLKKAEHRHRKRGGQEGQAPNNLRGGGATYPLTPNNPPTFPSISL